MEHASTEIDRLKAALAREEDSAQKSAEALKDRANLAAIAKEVPVCS